MKQRSYIDSIHFSGRIWMIFALLILLMVPTIISVYFDAWPIFNVFAMGLLAVAPTFWTASVIEGFVSVPMLGMGGSYLAFVTGNLPNVKIPCAVNAMQVAKVEAGTEEGEVTATISIAISSIVTTLIITAGMLLLTQIRPLLETPALAPAFAQVFPSLFGALAVVLIGRNWKVAVAPVAVMLIVFLFIPMLADAVAVLVPVGVLIALGGARFLYKKGWV
ncbi:MAG: hypothetical protein FWC72_01750 [Oscillospiraceae bacterium]|nr:hypothetical protein [Oscillospiraceae bacterium]